MRSVSVDADRPTARLTAPVASPEAVPVRAWAAVPAMDVARLRTALEIEPSRVVSDDEGSGAIFEAASLVFGDVSSEGAEVRAETATDPIPITALPSRLSAEAPVLINRDEAESIVSASAGGGGSGSSSVLLFACTAAILSAFGLASPRFGFKSIALRESGDAGGAIGGCLPPCECRCDVVAATEGGGGGGGESFETGAGVAKKKESSAYMADASRRRPD